MASRRRNIRGRTPEGDVQSSILALLEVERIWFRRMQSRAFKVPGKGGKERLMFVGSVGMADVLATPLVSAENAAGQRYKWPVMLWIEVKAGKNGQSPEQKDFEAEVVNAGHEYIVARSIDDVRDWLKENEVSR